MRMNICTGTDTSTLRVIAKRDDIGTLIGAGEVAPMVVECRLGADIDGNIRWLYRSGETSGAWIEMHNGGDGELLEWNELRRELREVFPMHEVVWWERDGEYAWDDC